MKHLSKYRPAETLVVLEGKNASIKELLKFTFMDLLLKEVIETTTVSRQSSSSRETVRLYKYLVRGKNFLNYTPLEHEVVYLSPFQKSSSIKVLFQNLIRMGFENAQSESKYISTITKSPNVKSCFTRNFFQTVFGGFSISQDGVELRDKLTVEIAKLEKDLPPIVQSEKEIAQHILNTIGGNIFLLKNLDFLLLKQIDSVILAEMNRKSMSGEGGSGCYGCSSWDYGYSSDGGSGCSGSGCSGSGCSGCGGCGGGCGGCS